MEYASSGEVIRIVSVVQDVSERVAAEEELRAQSAVLSNLLAHAPLILIALDREGVFTMHEGAGLDGISREQGEFVGQCLWDAEPERQVRLRRVFAGETVHELVEVRGRQLDAYYRPVLDDAGRVAGAVGVSVDVTELMTLEAELRQSQKMEVVGQLAGGITHDFNNLLQVIGGYAQILRDGIPSDGAQQADLAQILAAEETAAALTQQLLTFSRRQPREPIVIDPNTLLRDIEGLLRPLVRENVQLVLNYAAQGDQVLVDRAQMQTVILNLVANAVDAMPHGGTLTVGTQSVDLGEFSAPPSRPPAWPLHRAAGGRHGRGHRTRGPGTNFRAFLDNQGAGTRRGAGLGDRLRHRGGEPRRDPR